jgi:drug/metabolite transporter (DMT)-like permease
VDWSASHWLAIGFALLAAFCTAVGIAVRQRAVQDELPARSESGAIVTSWVRDRTWWVGTGAAVVGYAFQALALASGSLLLVQPLLVSALLFVLPLGARLSRQRVWPSDWAWALLLTAALTVFIVVGRPRESAGHHPASALAWTVVFAVALPPVVGCTLGARRSAGRLRASLLAVPVAVLLGLTAVLTKVCTHRISVSGWHGLLTVPAPYAFVVLAVSVTVLQQLAFNAGALQASVPVMLVGEPVVAVLIGVMVLGEGLTVHGLAAPALVAAVGAMTAATIALARGSGAHRERLSKDVSGAPSPPRPAVTSTPGA